MYQEELKAIQSEYNLMSQDYEKDLLQLKNQSLAKDSEINSLRIIVNAKEDAIVNLRSHIDRFCSVTSSQSLDISVFTSTSKI
jgi:hypothetical protein